jgi:hypothetical protein
VSIVVAIAALGGAWFGCLLLVRAVRVRSVALGAPLALAVLVGAEAVVLRALSAFRAVHAGPVALTNVALLAAGVLAAWRVPRARTRPPRLRRIRWAVATPLAILFALAATSALAYLPNNWDSMTYHLARVAHWIQSGSVAVYPTGTPRQNVLPPGAEYLILVLQVISGTDRLAGLVQLASWAVLVSAAIPLARQFGASRAVAGAGAVVVGSAPMVVIQASSTQNDLVAAAMTAAMVIAAVPFLHRRRRWRRGDLVLLLAAVAGGVLVKPTSAVVAAPLVLAAAVLGARTILAGGRRAMLEVAPVAALAALLALPLAVVGRAGTGATEAFVYGGAPELGDRAANAVRGALRNLPVPERVGDLLAPQRTAGCDRPGRLCLRLNRLAHEDRAGNPALAILALAAAALAAVRWRSLHGRARLGAAALVAGWVLFHALLRDNAWITRLQLPAVVLVVASLGAFPRRGWGSIGRLGLAAFVAVAFALGVRAATQNLQRPLQPWWSVRLGGAPSAYYTGGPVGLGAMHGQVLRALERSGCTRLGLFIGADSYDYPLTWRAMQRGIRVRHVVGPQDWPCAVWSDRGQPPARPDGAPWLPRDPAGYFEVR